MIEDHYGFTGSPFRLMPDPRFFYASRNHRAALEFLRYGLHQGEGFVVITGEVGTGKTTLMQLMLEELDTGRFVAAPVVTTAIEPEDAVRLFVAAFGIQVSEPGKAAQIEAFRHFLLGQKSAGRRIVLLVDEAQNLPLRTLEELRMLSNLTEGSEPLVQIFLLGQPQFRTTLAGPNMEQFRQRITASYHLAPLSAAEARAYIEHRLAAVGWTGAPSFSDACLERIQAETGGIPRRINTLCTRLLLYGCLEEIVAFEAKHVDAVVRDFQKEGMSAAPQADGRAGPGAPMEAGNAVLEARVAKLEKLLGDVLGTAVGVLAAEMKAGSNGRADDEADDGAIVESAGLRG